MTVFALDSGDGIPREREKQRGVSEMRLRTVCLLAMLALPAIAEPQEQRGFVIVGSGASSCGSFLDALSKSDSAERTPESVLKMSMMLAWTQGYISGMNSNRKIENPRLPMLVLPDSATVRAYLEKYCRDHPLDSVKDGSFSLFADVLAKAAKE
jgi:hypothetical protein